MPSLEGKRALVLGVANERSIAWGITQKLAAEGAQVALTFLGDTLEKRVRPLADKIGADLVLPCDASQDDQIAAMYEAIDAKWGGLDILIHAIAFADRQDLMGRFVDTSREGFRLALDVSAYSLVSLSRGARPLMISAGGGSIVTLTFDGSQRVFPNYNVMGVAKAALESATRYLAADLGPENIRVNAVSPGPIKTLSAAGIRNFRDMLKLSESKSPLGRNISTQDVAELCALLAGDGGSGITGQVLKVDAGLSILGV
ncbi:MAG: enoyl-ACP reductase [Candidatus Binatia bacterium]|jgi:enoyl-[acyl-carrier protein] reductase I|nr:enoyl-ACP reductase [Candidatus Binatia bacterium]MDG2008781.1 enoyl-ACP reductase [Candidatus Binatia bacterium]HAC79200.1 NADH-specific enoyl-ACP reductase [Deltaproteobacteria bacterium]